MTLQFTATAVAATPGQQISLSSLIKSDTAGLPEYLVLTGLDRDEYTAASTGAKGSLSGNGHVASFVGAPGGGDEYNIGLVFTHTAAGYFNDSYGYLTDLTYTASTDIYRSAYLALYGFGSAGQANAAQFGQLSSLANSTTGNPSPQFYMAPPAGSTALGSVDIVTRSKFSDSTPGIATPAEIAAVAAGFVGQVWNSNGCWVLASNIAAAAGVSLPVSSASPLSLAPQAANGEWVIAYDSSKATAAQQQTWQTQLKPGDIVAYDQYCGGHIVTVTSGAGYGAMIVDNFGASAGDGAANDIVIEAPHDFNDVFASGGLAQYVVIYRLDTPIVTPALSISLRPGASIGLAGSFSVQDPAGKPVTAYQVYDSGSGALGGSFTIGGVTAAAHSADTALTVAAASLAGASFTAGSGAGSDGILIRAFNGTYWGDWQSIGVTVGSGTQAPVLHVTTDQTVARNGAQISLSSLVTASAPDSPIVSYIIHDPALGSWGSGHVLLNGAVNLLGTASNPSQDMTYQVSAADFAKLTYIGSGFLQNGENVTVTAVNQAQQSSLPVDLPIMSVGLQSSGISHFLTPGTTIPVSQMFALSNIDPNFPVKNYIFELDSSLTDKINLNGATNLIPAASVIDSTGWAHYEIAAADLGKVTYTAGTASGQFGNELIVAAVDSALSVTNAFPKEHAATAPVQIAAVPTSVVIGSSVALTSLFSLAPSAATLKFHIFDPQGGGQLALNGAANLLGKDADIGEYQISGADLGKVTYTGGLGSEKLLIATSADNGASWAPESAVSVSGFTDIQTAAAMKTQATQIGANPLFDAAYYIAHNSDVARSGIDPLQHYELFGWKEGRDPSAFFSTKGYLAANPDVKLAGIDPLDHYLDFGIAEGRPLGT